MAERDGPAHAGQGENDAEPGCRGRRHDQPIRFGSQVPEAACLVKPEQLEYGRPGRREEDQEQDILDADARGQEAVKTERHLRVHADQHREHRRAGGKTVEAREDAGAAYQSGMSASGSSHRHGAGMSWRTAIVSETDIDSGIGRVAGSN